MSEPPNPDEPEERGDARDEPRAEGSDGDPREPGDDPTRATLSFTWRFLAILGLLSLLLYLDDEVWGDAIVHPLTVISAKLVAWNMELVGFDVVLRANSVTYAGHGFSIIADCIGLEVHGLFIAAVLAVPAAFVLKLRGIAMGVPVLILVNHVRMMTLVILGARSAEWLDIGHLYVWPIIVIMVAIGLWLSWIRIIQDDPRFLA